MILSAATESSPYTGPLVLYCLVAGGFFLVVGLVLSIMVDIPTQRAAADAARVAAAKPLPKAGPVGKVDAQAQSAVSDTTKAVSELVAAMKDLTLGARLAMIGVFLVAIAAIGAGADAIGDASQDSPGASTSTSTPTG